MNLPAYSQAEALDLIETAHSIGFREALAFVVEMAELRALREKPEMLVAFVKSILEGYPPGHRAEDFDELVGVIRSARRANTDRLTLAFRVAQLAALWKERGEDVVRSGKAIKDDFTIGEGVAMQRCGDVLSRSLGPK